MARTVLSGLDDAPRWEMVAHSHRLFGTDGVRGRAGEQITPDLALRVGGAFAALLRQRSETPTVLLARDTRLSSPALAEAVGHALAGCGVRVLDLGIFPTGGLCLLVRARGVEGGVVVSASHNPPESNGIKLVDRGGLKLPVEQQRGIEVLVRDGAFEPTVRADGVIAEDASEEYLELVLEGLPPNCLDGMRVVLDCAHGSAWQLAPEAFERAGAQVEAINCDADGAHINVRCGSTTPQAMADAVVRCAADLGVAFDGDADRAVFADHTGRVIDGDASKYVLAVDLQERGLLTPPVVVGTVMNNFGLERALAARGISLLRTPVGDRYVVAVMRESGALLGGEQSGHIIFASTLIGDGIYTALRVCEVVARTRRPLAELAAPVRKIPQLLVNVPARDRHAWERCEEARSEIARWERRLDGCGRVLVRPSGTEPLVRIMVEAESDELAREACDTLAAIIRRACGQ
ncbi:MAG: phosphoglucosamine mutase [Armatimonadota bacterium]